MTCPAYQTIAPTVKKIGKKCTRLAVMLHQDMKKLAKMKCNVRVVIVL
jgi:hypothetical protein